MESEMVVRFASHPRPFLVRHSYCANPDCPCQDVRLTFTETSDTGRALKRPISFVASVDVYRWQATSLPGRPAEVAAWVEEFLDRCPLSRRAEFKASYEECKRVARRKAEYVMDAEDVLEGILVPYTHLLGDRKPLSEGGDAYTFDVHYQGRHFLVDDCYCPNPRCDCREVCLDFFEAVTEQDGKCHVYQRFLGRVPFSGRLIVEKTFKFGQDEAHAVLAAWWKQYGDGLKLIKDRYRDVKQVGRRSLDVQRSRERAVRQPTAGPLVRDQRPDDSAAANTRVGRNAVCPCGSGKKFKKCCGRRTVLPS
jgi:hypothetical protein